MKKDAFGDRMKRYELEDAGRRLMPRLPIMARLDGRAFHSFTRGLEYPFDARFTHCMIETMKFLVKHWNVTLAYRQSDEITLYWENSDIDAQMPFDGRVQKLVSLLASSASVRFYQLIHEHLPEKDDKIPELDCRVWQLPTYGEVYNAFLWREQDATRNSLQMAARSLYSHKQLHGKGYAALHDMLHEKGVNWNDLPAFFKRGTYARTFRSLKIFTKEELEAMNDKARSHALQNPVLRSEVRCVVANPLSEYGMLANLLAEAGSEESPISKGMLREARNRETLKKNGLVNWSFK
jgi:tRNA(His) 5'-end guanylyltransferase